MRLKTIYERFERVVKRPVSDLLKSISAAKKYSTIKFTASKLFDDVYDTRQRSCEPTDSNKVLLIAFALRDRI